MHDQKAIIRIQFVDSLTKSDDSMVQCLHDQTSDFASFLIQQLSPDLVMGFGSMKFDYQFNGTVLQQKVWNALRTVPLGKTVTYQELARMAGLPRAVRAVASACAKNPLLIIVPCHRVILSSGRLGQYKAGAWRKEMLLAKEAFLGRQFSS